jgi:hypothetical protein
MGGNFRFRFGLLPVSSLGTFVLFLEFCIGIPFCSFLFVLFRGLEHLGLRPAPRLAPLS